MVEGRNDLKSVIYLLEIVEGSFYVFRNGRRTYTVKNSFLKCLFQSPGRHIDKYKYVCRINTKLIFVGRS